MFRVNDLLDLTKTSNRIECCLVMGELDVVPKSEAVASSDLPADFEESVKVQNFPARLALSVELLQKSVPKRSFLRLLTTFPLS